MAHLVRSMDQQQSPRKKAPVRQRERVVERDMGKRAEERVWEGEQGRERDVGERAEERERDEAGIIQKQQEETQERGKWHAGRYIYTYIGTV